MQLLPPVQAGPPSCQELAGYYSFLVDMHPGWALLFILLAMIGVYHIVDAVIRFARNMWTLGTQMYRQRRESHF